MTHMIWTYHLSHGEPLSLKVEGNPVMAHNGVMSIWHMYLSEEQRQYVKTLLEAHTVLYKEYGNADRGSEGLRQRMIDVSKPDFVFRYRECQMCFYFDPLTESTCGYEDWPPESCAVAPLGLPSEKAQADLIRCPLYGETES